MEFYSVYKIDDNGGQHGHMYFMSFDKAHECYLKWEEEEPESTILPCYECTED